MSGPAAAGPLPEAPWGDLLAVYFMLLGVSSGITMVSWWLCRKPDSAARRIERHCSWVSLGVLMAAAVLLVADLGRPSRFYLMLTSFGNLGSPIAVGAKLIALKAFLLAVTLYAAHRREQRAGAARAEEAGNGPVVRRIGLALPWLLVTTSFALALYPAAVLARTWSSPLAGSSGSALLFLLTALLMGAAVAVLIASAVGEREADASREVLRFGRRTTPLLLGALAVALVFEGLSIGVGGPDGRALQEVLTGGLAATFWGLVVLVGMALPVAAATLAPARRVTRVFDASAVLVGAAAARYLLFAAGQ